MIGKEGPASDNVANVPLLVPREGGVDWELSRVPLSQSGVDFSQTEAAFRDLGPWALRLNYLLFRIMAAPALSHPAQACASWAVRHRIPLASSLVRWTIYRQFCGGENLEEAMNTAAKLRQGRLEAILDYAMEGAEDEPSLDETRDRTAEAIERAAGRPEISHIAVKISGIVQAKVLEKVQAGEKLSLAEQESYEKGWNRLQFLAQRAEECEQFLFLDAEETWIQGVIASWALTLMRRHNKELPIIQTAYQMYLKSSLRGLGELVATAERENFIAGLKLVRGAYMTQERARAAERGLESPINDTKELTDAMFNAGLRLCLGKLGRVWFCAATHNEESCSYLMDLMKAQGVANGDPRVSFAQLLGMSNNISHNLAQAGYHVSKYLPFGSMRAVLPYLIRRAQENESMAGHTAREVRYREMELRRRKGRPSG